ncbi:MAG: response regulator [Candidatus Bathyarchaeia archaeon]|nr:response regulator [Candidatus Bathyarchaeota archaeon]
MARRVTSSYTILLVEDSMDDALITKRAMSKVNIMGRLIIVNDGEEALKLLRREGEYKDFTLPSLIILDLKMPKVNGFEVLRELRRDERLRVLPVIVFTSSDRSEDIELAYRLGCNSYIVKPVRFEDFLRVMEEIKRYWLETSEIPT